MTRTLLDDTVLITRATVETAVERLALSAAHGSCQLATVREWIENGTLKISVEPIPGGYNWRGQQSIKYVLGSHGLSGLSKTNLIKRLRAAGFIIEIDRMRWTARLYWKAY